MRHDLQRHRGGAVGVAVAVAANPGGELDGSGVDRELLAEGDAALGVKLAKVGGDSVPENRLDDSVSSCSLLLNSGLDTSVFNRNSLGLAKAR